jgi:hypothetical protein
LLPHEVHFYSRSLQVLSKQPLKGPCSVPWGVLWHSLGPPSDLPLKKTMDIREPSFDQTGAHHAVFRSRFLLIANSSAPAPTALYTPFDARGDYFSTSRMCSASCTSGLYIRVWGWVGRYAGGGLVRVVRLFFRPGWHQIAESQLLSICKQWLSICKQWLSICMQSMRARFASVPG